MGIFNYDAWLEKPYQDMCEQDAIYEKAEELLADEIPDEEWEALTEKEQQAIIEERVQKILDDDEAEYEAYQENKWEGKRNGEY